MEGVGYGKNINSHSLCSLHRTACSPGRGCVRRSAREACQPVAGSSLYASRVSPDTCSLTDVRLLPASRYAGASAEKDHQVQGANDAAVSASYDMCAGAVRSTALSSPGMWSNWVPPAVSASGGLVLISG